MNLPIRAATAAALFLLSACVSSKPDQPIRKPHEGPWLQPSMTLEQQLDDQIRRLPWTHGAARVEQIRWFTAVGEPAYPRLLELCSDPRPDVAGAALAALGATHDARLVEHLHQVKWVTPMEPGLRLERARALVRLGDWSEVGVLVAGLRDESLWTRAWCGQALHEATNERFGFDPRAEAEEREQAVLRWEQWLMSRLGEGILLSRSTR